MNIEFKISKKPVVYDKAIRFLEKRVEKVKNGGREFIWILEHPITYTAGVRFNKKEIFSKKILGFVILDFYRITLPRLKSRVRALRFKADEID